MDNILLTITYDGTNYFGWQRQNNAVTIQEKVENAISDLLLDNVVVTGSSRTDAGVHALGQKATFRVKEMKIPIDKLPYAINTRLPDDIVVNRAEVVESCFHPRYAAKEKIYEYRIYSAPFPNPILKNYCWFIHNRLDIKSIEEAASYFVGTHDFSAFCAAGSTVKNMVRVINRLEVKTEGNLLSLRISGNGFLYNMVRIIAGTLVYVGLCKIKPCEIPGILASGERSLAGKTAPPGGLTLVEILY